MTEIQKSQELLEEVKCLTEELMNSSKKEEAFEENTIKKYILLSEKLEGFLPKFTKYKARIAEKDEDKKMYGPKTAKLLQEMLEKYEAVYATFEEELAPKFEEKANQRKTELFNFLQSEKERKKKEEEERIQQGKLETLEEEKKRTQNLQAALKEEEEKKQKEKEREEQEKILKEKKEARDEEVREIVEEMEKFYENENDEYLCIQGLYKLAKSHFGEHQQVISHLFEMFDEVNSNPSSITCRVIRISNKEFQKHIGKKSGTTTILRSFGFRTKTAVQILYLLTRLGKTVEDPSEFYFALEEPNIIQDFEAWKNWITRIERIRNLMKQVKDNVGYIKTYEGFVSYLQSIQTTSS